MALTANREVDHYIDQELRSYPVAESAHVYKGALVGITSDGFARGLIAGDSFAGIAYEETNNDSGSDGDLSVRVYTLGDFGLSLAGATAADVGRPVFASGDDTLSIVGAANSYVGIIENVVSSGQIILRIDPGRRQIKTAIHAVEDLDAGADVAARAMHVFENGAWVVSARVVNQASAAAGIDNSNLFSVTVATGAGTVASEVFNSTTPFPDANSAYDLAPGVQRPRRRGQCADACGEQRLDRRRRPVPRGSRLRVGHGACRLTNHLGQYRAAPTIRKESQRGSDQYGTVDQGLRSEFFSRLRYHDVLSGSSARGSNPVPTARPTDGSVRCRGCANGVPVGWRGACTASLTPSRT